MADPGTAKANVAGLPELDRVGRPRHPLNAVWHAPDDIGQPLHDIGQPLLDIGQPLHDIGLDEIRHPLDDIGYGLYPIRHTATRTGHAQRTVKYRASGW